MDTEEKLEVIQDRVRQRSQDGARESHLQELRMHSIREMTLNPTIK